MILKEAIQEVMKDDAVRDKYPEGMTALNVLDEIRLRHGQDAFELCTWLDVHDDMVELYGSP